MNSSAKADDYPRLFSNAGAQYALRVELVISSAVIFLMIMDPVGNAPLFLTALRNTVPSRHRRIIIREMLIALVLMVLFLFGGQSFMRLFHIETPTLSVAGGIVLILIALRMVFPTPEKNLKESIDDEPFIVPMAVPYTAGPSLLAMEVVFVSGNPEAIWQYLLALVIAWLASAITLFFASSLQRIVGEKVLTAIERLMGLVLVIVATQMSLDGVATYFGLH